jgi:ribonuclease HI
MIAYEATSAALAACDTLQRTQEIVIQTDSTLLRMLHNTIAQERKNVAKERRKGTLKAIGSFVVGFLAGRGA